MRKRHFRAFHPRPQFGGTNLFPWRSVIASAMITVAIAALPASALGQPRLQEQLTAAESRYDHAAVAELCRRLLTANPGDVEILGKLARAELNLGDEDRSKGAIDAFEKASGTPTSKVLHLRAAHARRHGNAEEAFDFWKKALEVNPEDPDALRNVVRELRERGQDLEARPLVLRLVKTSPRATDYIFLARTAIATRDWTQAVQYSSLASETKADEAIAWERTYEAFLPQIPRLTRLDQKIAGPVGSANDYYQRARLLASSGFPDLALLDASIALGRKPSAPHLTLTKALIHVLLKNPKGANELGVSTRVAIKWELIEELEAIQREIDRSKQKSRAIDKQLIAQANMLNEQKQFMLATEVIKPIGFKNRSAAAAYHERGIAALGLGKPREAQILFAKSVDKDSTQHQVWERLADMQMGRGQYESALRSINHAMRPENAKKLRKMRHECFSRLQRIPSGQ